MSTKTKELELIDLLQESPVLFHDINILLLSQVYLFELRFDRLPHSTLLNIIKRYSLDSIIKAFQSVFIKSSNKTDIETLFVNDVFNLSMIQNIRRVELLYDKSYSELIVDKRLKSKHSLVLWKHLRIWNMLFQVPSFMAQLWKSRKTIKKVSDCFGVNRFLVYLNLFDSFFVIECLSSFFSRHKNIKHVFLNSDVHKVSRGVVLLSRQNKSNTYVLQHGTTVLEYGYIPVLANYMFTWGELSKQWFLKRDVDENQLVITGTPKMDSVQVSSLSNKKKVNRILVIINPIGERNVLDFLRIIYDSNIHQTKELTIKLHPSSADNRQEVLSVFGDTDVIIKKDQEIHELLAETDVVITTSSTVGNEAIAFMKPLIQISLGNSDIYLDYNKYDCSLEVFDAQGLKTNIENPDKLFSKIENYESFISKYFYRLDGNSTERIINFVKK